MPQARQEWTSVKEFLASELLTSSDDTDTANYCGTELGKEVSITGGLIVGLYR